MKFCDNPVCAHHVEVPAGMNRLRYITASGNDAETARFRIYLQDQRKSFYFCSTCVNVVALIQEP